MTSRSALARPAAVLAILLASTAVVATPGCTQQKKLLNMPTLHEVSPTGPKGKKCYDRCAHAEVSCRHMCPQTEGLCQEDCVTDTKWCLSECPELFNHPTGEPVSGF